MCAPDLISGLERFYNSDAFSTINRETMKKRAQLDAELVEYIDKVLTVCSSRAAYVINTIFRDGFIDSETIRDEGYVHGARAIGDVRDNGVPLTTLKTKSSGGKSIAFDLPPFSRTSVISRKSVNQESDGHEEEQIHRRTDHRVHQAGSGRHADQGAVPQGRLQ